MVSKESESLRDALREARAEWDALPENERQRINERLSREEELSRTWRPWVPIYGLRYISCFQHPANPKGFLLYHFGSATVIAYFASKLFN